MQTNTDEPSPPPTLSSPTPTPARRAALRKILVLKLPLRKLALIALIIALLGVAFVGLANLAVVHAARGRMYDELAQLPVNDVGLVLGARSNTYYFANRVTAAAELYRAGKVRHLLVSGDNHVKGYDEPTDMKLALIAAGVPESAVTCDYAGFRTLDSLVRARAIFGQRRLTIVSQRFHNPRALLVARRCGIDAVAFNAPDVPEWNRRRTEAREALARPLAVVDLYLIHRRPRFLGPREPIAIADQKEPDK